MAARRRLLLRGLRVCQPVPLVLQRLLRQFVRNSSAVRRFNSVMCRYSSTLRHVLLLRRSVQLSLNGA